MRQWHIDGRCSDCLPMAKEGKYCQAPTVVGSTKNAVARRMPGLVNNDVEV